jgi:AhpD family alkylhydroperoxidase
MKARLDFRQASPGGMKAMSGLHAFVHDCGLDLTLLEPVKLRASQINGCGHCIDMHVKEVARHGRRRSAASSSRRLVGVALLRRSRARGIELV